MTRVAVVSSVYGDYDPPAERPEQTVDAEWVYVTDRQEPTFSPLARWDRVVVEPRPWVHPRLAAKVAKCLPWRYAQADAYVWVDGSCRLLRGDALEWLLDQSEGAALTQFRHPWRSCVFEEALASEPMPKYQGLPVAAQVAEYARLGHPRHWGLWATGLIVYRPAYAPGAARDVVGLQNAWLAEQLRWTYQDQLSQPFVLRELGYQPRELRLPSGEVAPLHGSGYLEWAGHRSEL